MSVDPLFDLTEEVVVVTGVAGQLGASYASAFLTRGARVVGIDTVEPLPAVGLAGNARFRFSLVSVIDRKALFLLAGKLAADNWRPTVLVNNAGIDSPPSAPAAENGPFEDYPEESWDRVMDVNLKGVYLCCQAFGGAMAAAGRGSIINIASIYGMVAPDQSLYEYRRRRGETFFKPVAYAASKSGVLNLTRYLAVYWAKAGVRVNSLTIAGVFANQEQAFLDAYCGRIPLGRMATRNEYDGAVLFLASQASTYMTGANLVVDGGWTAI